MLGYLQFLCIDNRIQRSKQNQFVKPNFFSNSNKQCTLSRDSEKPFRKGILIFSFIKRSILSLHNLVVRLSVVVGSWIPSLIENRECSQGSPREGVSCSLINIVFYGERRQSICRVRPRTPFIPRAATLLLSTPFILFTKLVMHSLCLSLDILINSVFLS